MPVASCQFCRWTPVPHIPYWKCMCGELFDAFGHKGHCPACQERLALVRCPKCAIIKQYGWWLGEEYTEPGGTVMAHIAESWAPSLLQEQAAAWINSREQYLKANPLRALYWRKLLAEQPEAVDQIDLAIKKMAAGYGFTSHHPLSDISIGALEPALNLTGAVIIDSCTPLATVKENGVTNRCTLQTGDGLTCGFYHFIGLNENK